ncbi:hypothetical protein J23TS9_36520 [Paenibacillus sp. J23TS9]|uniref:hypothetical protein n=1 Tax=Paenibacillus sp. J23TS9 TaxID=2807193 RepID=UPI001B2670EE|nr:hypothetical protein [Paenibacillus sp. J23TS9]GIP28522.1 hypothetical protein J23TS9_36520 [Paenibacillus sp. J23TS9]
MTINYPFGPGFQHNHPLTLAYDPYAYTFRSPFPPSFYYWPMPGRAYPYTGAYPGYSPYPAYPAYPSPYPGISYTAPYPPLDPSRVEPTPKGFQVKLEPKPEQMVEHTHVENVQVENHPGMKMNTGIEVGGKHGAGFQAATQLDKHGVSNQVSSHVGSEAYGLNMQGEANLNNTAKGFQFETGSQLGGKYGIQAHVEGHAGMQQGIGLNTEAQIGGEHGLGAHVKSQLGGGQGAEFSTGAQIGGDHGLGAHAGAQVGGGQGVSLKLGGNVGSHDGQVGINLGGKEKKQAE